MKATGCFQLLEESLNFLKFMQEVFAGKWDEELKRFLGIPFSEVYSMMRKEGKIKEER